MKQSRKLEISISIDLSTKTWIAIYMQMNGIKESKKRCDPTSYTLRLHHTQCRPMSTLQPNDLSRKLHLERRVDSVEWIDDWQWNEMCALVLQILNEQQTCYYSTCTSIRGARVMPIFSLELARNYIQYFTSDSDRARNYIQYFTSDSD
jgi:hypothetical protein